MAEDVGAGEELRGYFVDWGKLATLALVLVTVMVLALADKLPEATITAVVFAVVGYVSGNGAQARKGEPPQPLLGRRSVLQRPKPVTDDVDLTDRVDLTEAELEEPAEETGESRRRDR